MEINTKCFSIDVQNVNISILNEYISHVKEMVNAIKYIADANDHVSIVYLAQKVSGDIDNINSIIESAIQN